MNPPTSSTANERPTKRAGHTSSSIELDIDARVYEHNKMLTPIAATVEIVAGCFVFFFYIGMMVVRAWSFQAGFGFWAGFAFVLCGCVSIAAHKIKKLLYILLTLFGHMVTFLFAFVLFVVSCVGLNKHETEHYLLQQKSYEMVMCDSYWDMTNPSLQSFCQTHKAERNIRIEYVRDGVVLHALLLVLTLFLLPSIVIQIGLCVRAIDKVRRSVPIAPEGQGESSQQSKMNNRHYPANIVSMV
jgi:hypothetical protein